MKSEEILDLVAQLNSKALVAKGLEEAVIGYVERFGQEPLVLFDKKRCITILMETSEMTMDEAEEYFDFNVIGAWMGDGTPCFATILKR